jgi:HEPN domain-containing protein
MKTEAEDWLRYADEDYAVGIVLREKYVRNSVWSFQQSAEKYLKALLTESGIDFPKTHDCVALVNLGSWPTKETISEHCLRLAEYGPSRRYPGENLPITAEDVALVFVAATRIRDWCFNYLGLPLKITGR